MITAWTKHIKDEAEKQQFEKSLLNSKWAFERLTVLLDEIQQNIEDSESSAKVYEKANWPYWQAHHNGYKNCIKTIKKLITLDPKDTNDPRLTQS